MNNSPEIDNSIDSFPSDLPQKFAQYRPSRSLNNRDFSYVWNGWADGNRSLPKTMLGEFHWMITKLAGNKANSTYENYIEKKNFIEFRTREELYDLSKDPSCRTNLSNNDHHQATLKDFRNRMKQVLQKTNDHELNNYITFLNKK